jgi:hypothetical protein
VGGSGQTGVDSGWGLAETDQTQFVEGGRPAAVEINYAG